MPGMPTAKPVDVCQLADTGYWELLPVDSQVLAVHAVLMHTGPVLSFAGSGNNVPHFNAHLVRSVVWDYHEGTFYDPGCPFDVFCSSQTVLADGKVLVAGGTDKYDDFVGSQATYLFDPQLRQWIRVDDMDAHRWYPTLVTTGDGRAVVSSGIQAPNEVFDPAIGWRLLPNTTSLPLYPHLLLLQDSHLFYTGGQLGNATVEGRTINPLTGAEQTVSGLRDKAKRDQGNSILLPPAQEQRVMVIGGGGAPSATKRTDIIDLSAGPGGAAFHSGPDLARARGLCNSVILPDRTVLVTGGGLHGETRADAVHLSRRSTTPPPTPSVQWPKRPCHGCTTPSRSCSPTTGWSPQAQTRTAATPSCASSSTIRHTCSADHARCWSPRRPSGGTAPRSR